MMDTGVVLLDRLFLVAQRPGTLRMSTYWGRALFGISFGNTVLDEVDGFLNLQFFHHVGAVMFHRPGADEEKFSDLPA